MRGAAALLPFAAPVLALHSAPETASSGHVHGRGAIPIDLSTPAGRRRARRELVWGDHGFLRARFRNLHRISDEM